MEYYFINHFIKHLKRLIGRYNTKTKLHLLFIYIKRKTNTIDSYRYYIIAIVFYLKNLKGTKTRLIKSKNDL